MHRLNPLTFMCHRKLPFIHELQTRVKPARITHLGTPSYLLVCECCVFAWRGIACSLRNSKNWTTLLYIHESIPCRSVIATNLASDMVLTTLSFKNIMGIQGCWEIKCCIPFQSLCLKTAIVNKESIS